MEHRLYIICTYMYRLYISYYYYLKRIIIITVITNVFIIIITIFCGIKWNKASVFMSNNVLEYS